MCAGDLSRIWLALGTSCLSSQLCASLLCASNVACAGCRTLCFPAGGRYRRVALRTFAESLAILGYQADIVSRCNVMLHVVAQCSAILSGMMPGHVTCWVVEPYAPWHCNLTCGSNML